MIRPTTTVLAGIALLGLLGLGACSDDDDDSASSTTAEASAEAVDCEGTPGETTTIVIADFEFDPDAVQIATCDRVVWSNEHTQSHTSTGNGDFDWSTGNITAGTASPPVVFDTPGDFTYMCALHPFMHGAVEVS